mgnify:CR=1 FL=1
MTLIRRPSPLGELMSLRQAMDRLFEDSFVRPARAWTTYGEGVLPLDVRSDPDELVVVPPEVPVPVRELEVRGRMVGGRQDLVAGKELTYGQSITDGCIDWDSSLQVLVNLAASVRQRRLNREKE